MPQRSLKDTNQFIAMYNDIVNYPTINDVADAFGISESRASSLISEIRRKNEAEEPGIDKIASRANANKTARTKKEKKPRPGQTFNELTERPRTLSEHERDFREGWGPEDCIKHLRAIVEAVEAETGTTPFITRTQFRNESNISDATWNRYFGTFNEFRRQAGLELSRHAHRIERSIAKHASTDRMDKLTDFKRNYEGRYERGSSDRFQTILIGTDFHGLKCDPFVKRMFKEANQRIQPEIINLNGDFLDMAEFSKYTSDPREFDVMGEIEDLHALLGILREENPNAQIDFIEGNHEFRLFRHLSEQTPALKVLLCDLHGFDIPKLLGLDRFEINFTGRASLKAFTEKDVKKELERNFKIYFDCVLSCHYPNRRNLRIPGWGGHHHKHEVWPFFNPTFGACEFHQMGGGQMRRADFMDGEIWQNGFMMAHVDTHKKTTAFEYVPVHDFCVLGGVFYGRRKDEEVVLT